MTVWCYGCGEPITGDDLDSRIWAHAPDCGYEKFEFCDCDYELHAHCWENPAMREDLRVIGDDLAAALLFGVANRGW